MNFFVTIRFKIHTKYNNIFYSKQPHSDSTQSTIFEQKLPNQSRRDLEFSGRSNGIIDYHHSNLISYRGFTMDYFPQMTQNNKCCNAHNAFHFMQIYFL